MSDSMEEPNLSVFDCLSKEKELREKLTTLYGLELIDVEEAFLLDQLKEIFIDITCLQFHQTQESQTLLPWVTFLAKEESFCKILQRLVSEDQFSSKFPLILQYVRKILSDEIVTSMEQAGFPLEQDFLLRLKLKNNLGLVQDPSGIEQSASGSLELVNDDEKIKNDLSDGSSKQEEIEVSSIKVFSLQKFSIES